MKRSHTSREYGEKYPLQVKARRGHFLTKCPLRAEGIFLVESSGLRLASLACISSACQKCCAALAFLEPLLSNLRFSPGSPSQKNPPASGRGDFLVESSGLRLASLACISSACQKCCAALAFLEPLLSNLRFSPGSPSQKNPPGLWPRGFFGGEQRTRTVDLPRVRRTL